MSGVLETVEKAERLQAEHVAQHETDLNLWTHRHRIDTDEARALNAVRNACQDAGARGLTIGGGLIATALLLSLTLTVAARRSKRSHAQSHG